MLPINLCMSKMPLSLKRTSLVLHWRFAVSILVLLPPALIARLSSADDRWTDAPMSEQATVNPVRTEANARV